MFKQLRSLCLGLVFVVALPLLARAEGITGSGTSEISHPATSLRMQLDLSADGKNITEAMAALKTKREALTAQLGKLGASADSITFTSPRIYTDPNQQQQRMQMMMQARMNGGKVAKSKTDEKVTVATTAKAQWPLEGTPDDILIRSYNLKKALEEGLKSKPAAPATGPAANAAAEEEEAAEENAGQYPQYDNGEVKPGTPVFVYVARITAQEREKALADAMAKAREQATQAAKAAGVQLGALRQASQHTISGNSGMEYGGYNGGYNRALYQMMNGDMRDGTSTSNEAVGADVGSVKLNVIVEASWDIK